MTRRQAQALTSVALAVGIVVVDQAIKVAVKIILGVDYKINDKWNVSAKYECPTRLNLKNKSEINIASDEVRAQAGQTARDGRPHSGR